MTELQQFIQVLEREKNIFKVNKDPDENGTIVTIFHYNSSNPYQVVCIDFDEDEKMAGTVGTCELFDDEEFEEFANMFRQSNWYEERYEQYWGRTMEFRHGKPTVEEMCNIIGEVYGGQETCFPSIMAQCHQEFLDDEIAYEDCLQVFYQLMK